jgi:hypothetical protein
MGSIVLIKEKLKPGCLIQYHDKWYEQTPRLILTIYLIEDNAVVYDALIDPSRPIVYHNIFSVFSLWDHV